MAFNVVTRILLLCCVVVTVDVSEAQIKTGDANSALISYSKSIPKAAVRLMPRGAKSLFWGQFVPKKGSATMAIHIFAPKKKFKKDDTSSTMFVHYTQVDIFRKSRGGFKRIKHLSLPDEVSDDKYESKQTAKVHFLWLNQKTQDRPVIAFDYFEGWDVLANGSGTFLVFDSTWQRHSVAGQLSFGHTGGAGSDWGYKALRDPQGDLEFQWGNSSYEGNEENFYHYDGTKFVVIPGRSTYTPREQ